MRNKILYYSYFNFITDLDFNILYIMYTLFNICLF